MNHPIGSILIFSYGTLKRDFPNYPLILQNDATFIGTYITRQPYPLVIGPHGIPFLINLPDVAGAHRVKGELYSVSATGIIRLDDLEGTTTGHYQRLPILIQPEGGGGEEITAEAYYAHTSFGERMWDKRGKAGLSEYSELWNESVDLTSAHGHKHQRVVSLKLPGKGLSGTTSHFIGNLTFLRFLDLCNGVIPGEVPVNIRYCSELRVLPFYQQEIYQLPLEIFLSFNNFLLERIIYSETIHMKWEN
ncbi:AIG2-like (avirulence induced gene) family protein [Euphorbia peplus]|nr:AIG2-like (avirulence induced gene) family protein [Euphorbia peplus]